jgi:hypothetical protein
MTRRLSPEDLLDGDTMTPDELLKWAERCEKEGRTAQAILVRNMAFEAEQGVPWLEIMRKHGFEIPKETP